MNKFYALKQLKANGDSQVLLKNGEGILVTTDFSEKYIKNMKYSRFTMQKTAILVFSWTDNKFRQINTIDIKKIVPLSAILKNKPPEVEYNG